MLHVRMLLLAGILAASGCAAPAKQAEKPAADSKALGERIGRICALAEPHRSQEIEKLKSETGMVLYCGK